MAKALGTHRRTIYRWQLIRNLKPSMGYMLIGLAYSLGDEATARWVLDYLQSGNGGGQSTHAPQPQQEA